MKARLALQFPWCVVRHAGEIVGLVGLFVESERAVDCKMAMSRQARRRGHDHVTFTVERTAEKPGLILI